MGKYDIKENMDDIYKIQTNCVKFITKNYKNYSRSELFLQNTILPFPILMQQELLKLGYKISNNMLPKHLIQLYRKNIGNKSHRYHTRKKNIPNIQ